MKNRDLVERIWLLWRKLEKFSYTEIGRLSLKSMDGRPIVRDPSWLWEHTTESELGIPLLAHANSLVIYSYAADFKIPQALSPDRTLRTYAFPAPPFGRFALWTRISPARPFSHLPCFFRSSCALNCDCIMTIGICKTAINDASNYMHSLVNIPFVLPPANPPPQLPGPGLLNVLRSGCNTLPLPTFQNISI